MMEGMGSWMGFGWVLWIVVIVGAFFIIKTVVEQDTRSAGVDPRVSIDSPLEILKRRYARGEIDGEEFQEKRKHLQEH